MSGSETQLEMSVSEILPLLSLLCCSGTKRKAVQAAAGVRTMPCLLLKEKRTLNLTKLEGVGCSAMTPTAVPAALPATRARALPCTDAYLGQ